MRFPLGDWIDAHPNVRHHLGQSGMVGAIPPPAPTARELRSADPEVLRAEIAERLGIARERLFLTHGATEGNAWTVLYLARREGTRPGRCRVRYPEYPPLFDAPATAGFDLVSDDRPAELAVVSQPRNPEGDEWPSSELLGWADGARHLLVDETFREFGRRRSLAGLPRDRLWATGTFTKFYGSDDIRVGWVAAPEEEATEFERFVGLFSDEIARPSVAAAQHALRHRARVARAVERIVGPNRRALIAAFPGATGTVGPVWFDRAGPGSEALCRRLLRRSVLVCPGRFFGDPNGLRLCLTRRTFPADLNAYLALRGRHGPGLTGAATRSRSARPPRGARGRARGARA